MTTVEIKEALALELELKPEEMTRRVEHYLEKMSRCCMASWLKNNGLSPCRYCLRDLKEIGFEWEFTQ